MYLLITENYLSNILFYNVGVLQVGAGHLVVDC